jgi:hypothetical protein
VLLLVLRVSSFAAVLLRLLLPWVPSSASSCCVGHLARRPLLLLRLLRHLLRLLLAAAGAVQGTAPLHCLVLHLAQQATTRQCQLQQGKSADVW